MTAAYATQHATALDMLRRKGAPETFTLVTPGTHDEATDTYADPVTTTVEGYVLQTRPLQQDVLAYQGASLVPSDVLTLLFAPTTYGELPPLGSSCSLGVVRSVRPVAPDGTAIIARVGVVR